jgi:hypothetical protein
MDSISVNIPVLLLVGIPQSFLTVLALHLFTQTKIDAKKYVVLSLICAVATYVIRLLPIALGVNTVLTLLVLIIMFQFAYKTQLSKVIRTIISATVILVLIAFTEVINMLFLTLLFSQQRATELLNSSDALTQGLSYAPSNIFFAVLILIGYLVVKKIDKRKKKNGEIGAKAGK